MNGFAAVARWRDEHAQVRRGLIEAYRANRRAQPLLAGLSRVADRLLAQVWRAQDLPANAALVAVGGYGRGELYPQSDVDVLILLDDALSDADRARFEPLIGLLWDVGLPIGHSVRNLGECVSEAAADLTIQTNMLEARLICGDAGLFAAMRERLQAALDPLAFLEGKRLEQQNRHGRFADRALLLEPNIKDSPGGLRDVQTVGWICRAAGLPTGFAGLARAGMLSPDEARRMARQLAFISQLRIRLHLIANRREDRLIFEFQERLAAEVGSRPGRGQRASERLMQRYFQASRELSLANEYLLGCVRGRLKPPPEPVPLPGQPGFQRRGYLLDIVDEDLPSRKPEAIFETFLILQREPELRALTPRTLRALWRSRLAIDARFRAEPRHRRQFLELLKEPRGITLTFRMMHRLGILGRYLPAFERITGQMQHDLYHIHPVDEHTLLVLRNLRRASLSEYDHELPFAHRLLAEFDRSDLLYLAALFHDIAKGRGGDHSQLGEVDARRFCRQHGLDTEDTELVAWLVRNHLSLSATAQKQDTSDPEVIAAFAGQCGDIRRLTALYLLTVADIRATNPAIWNSWKDKLTRELYLAARRHLEGDQPQQDRLEAKKEEARAALRLYGYEPGRETPLWKQLDDVYFLRHEAQEIAWQTRRLLPLIGREETIVRARLAPIGEGVEVVARTPDEAALFARICGFFAGMRYTVLSAKIHTTRDGYALDSFLVMDETSRIPYRDILNYIEYELTQALKARAPLADIAGGRLSSQLKAFPLQPEISLNAIEGGGDHLLSLVAGDRHGLLYDVARVLSRRGVDVKSARINTLGQRAEDVFVVAGDCLATPSKRLAIEQELQAVLRVA